MIPAVDGYPLAATHFVAAGDVRGAVIVNPATGVRRRYYDDFAADLAARGWQTVTFANRGIGGSRPERLRGFAARMQEWAELDSEGVLRWLLDEFPGLPVALVGHSFGGQSLGLVPSARRLAAAVLVATQSGYWGHWPGWQKLRLLAFWTVVIPLTTALCGYFPARRLGVGEDQPAGVARQWARWGRHRDYLLRDAPAAWRAGYDAIRMPILGIGFADDPYAPHRAMAAILSLYRNAAVDHRQIDPQAAGLGAVGHFGFFRPRFRDTLWPQASDWLAAAVDAGRAAGA